MQAGAELAVKRGWMEFGRFFAQGEEGVVCKGRQELLQGVLWEPAPAQHRSRGTARAQQDLQGVLALLREGKWRRKPLLSPLELLRLKDAFSQEEKALQFLLPAHNSLALIIAKCGSLCLCTCGGCQQHCKAVIEGKREKSIFLCLLGQSSWSISDALLRLLSFSLAFSCITKPPINRLVGEQRFCMLSSVIASSHWDCALSELDS